jgi:hypothetical protein
MTLLSARHLIPRLICFRHPLPRWGATLHAYRPSSPSNLHFNQSS